MAKICVQSNDFDASKEAALLHRGRTDIGALVTFVGLCRDEAGQLVALELEHYPGMAEAEIGRVVAEAEQRWPLLGVTVIHRFGRIAAGEQIVLTITAAAHRAPAFAAANFLMDYLKTRAPFWKKEYREDGSKSGWIAAKIDDDDAAARWR
jgi:molybdopterin synthase catalytic subunit